MPAMSALETAFCSSAAWHRFVGRRVLPWLGTQLPDRGHLVEVGAGAGGVADLLLRQRPDLQVTAVDLDTRMLRQARRRLDRHGPRAQVLHASATGLPAALDDQVDVVLSMLMLHTPSTCRAFCAAPRRRCGRGASSSATT